LRQCPFCAKQYKYLTEHLKTAHGKTKKEALEISSKNRAVQVGVKKTRKQFPCPVEGCPIQVARVDLHLRRVHKLNKEDPEYRRLAG
jgi:hypothetical protein